MSRLDVQRSALTAPVLSALLLVGCRSTGDEAAAVGDPAVPAVLQDDGAGEVQSTRQGNGVPPDLPRSFLDDPADLQMPKVDAESKPGDWLLVPVPFFSEQIGAGLALWGGYIFQFDPESSPSGVGVGGFYSENDSHALFAGFAPRFAEDTWRMTVLGGKGSMRYDFFGVGDENGEEGLKVPFVSEADIMRLEVLREVSDSLFLGPRLTYSSVSTRIDGQGHSAPGVEDQFDARDIQLGLHLQKDTRDNTFFPRQGHLADFSIDVSSEEHGSDFGYQRYALSAAFYRELDEQSVFAFRGLAEYAGGDAPFFFLPTHKLRGFEGGRYRDNFWMAAEGEYRHELSKRFGLAAFAGLGAVGDDLGELGGSTLLYGGGFGLRIRLTEDNPIDYRIDFATGVDDEVILYLSAGQAF